MSSFGPSRTKHESQFVQIFKNLENKQGQNRSVTDENYPYFKQISKQNTKHKRLNSQTPVKKSSKGTTKSPQKGSFIRKKNQSMSISFTRLSALSHLHSVILTKHEMQKRAHEKRQDEELRTLRSKTKVGRAQFGKKVTEKEREKTFNRLSFYNSYY